MSADPRAISSDDQWALLRAREARERAETIADARLNRITAQARAIFTLRVQEGGESWRGLAEESFEAASAFEEEFDARKKARR